MKKEVRQRVLFIAELLMTNNDYERLISTFTWINDKVSSDETMQENIQAIYAEVIRKLVEFHDNQLDFTSVNQQMDEKCRLHPEQNKYCLSELIAIEIRLLLSSGKLKEISSYLTGWRRLWKWQFMFTWSNDCLRNEDSLYPLMKATLASLHRIRFSELPLDIVQQLQELITILPVTNTCIQDFVQSFLNSIHDCINQMPFLMNESDDKDKEATPKHLIDLMSWSLLYILASKRSNDHRQKEINKSLSAFLETTYETCENVDYLLSLRKKILCCFDLTSVASKSAIDMKLEEGMELIKEMKHFFPNMWQDDLNQLILSTVTHEFLPTIETAKHVIHHYNDLSSIPKFRIQLNQLLNMKWKKVVLSQVDVRRYHTTESSKEKTTLCDYVMQSVPNIIMNPPIKSNRRKGFDKLCEQYVYSSLNNGPGLTENSNVWLSLSPESSFDENENCNNQTKPHRQSESYTRVSGKM